MVAKKKIKKPLEKLKENGSKDKDVKNLDLQFVKQSSKDSVRAIMLIRAYRIRGHLIANLDPLSIQKKKNIQNLNQKVMDLEKKIIIEKFF